VVPSFRTDDPLRENTTSAKHSSVYSLRSHQSLDFRFNSRSSQKSSDDEDSESDDTACRFSQDERPEAQSLLSSGAFSVRFASKTFLSPWFPEVDPSNPRAKTWRTWHSRREVLLTTCCAISGTVFLLNVAATIALRVRWKPDQDLGRIYKGDCNVSQRLSLSLHLVINGLSTLLFSSSNLCMQLLASPTRKEIDEAHRKWRWLDIGVPSIRNLRSIALDRRIAWIILGLSSVPLHFL
jgi:hypothetical protein